MRSRLFSRAVPAGPQLVLGPLLVYCSAAATAPQEKGWGSRPALGASRLFLQN